MNRITIEAVPQAAMRPPYDSETEAGDWFYDGDGNLVVRSIGTDLADPQTFLFAFHELIEAWLCRHRGIEQEQVDRFDEWFDEVSIGPDEPEPGDQPHAPYRREHREAMLLEHLLAKFMGNEHYGVVR